jgi:hypothetical protein
MGLMGTRVCAASPIVSLDCISDAIPAICDELVEDLTFATLAEFAAPVLNLASMSGEITAIWVECAASPADSEMAGDLGGFGDVFAVDELDSCFLDLLESAAAFTASSYTDPLAKALSEPVLVKDFAAVVGSPAAEDGLASALSEPVLVNILGPDEDSPTEDGARTENFSEPVFVNVFGTVIDAAVDPGSAGEGGNFEFEDLRVRVATGFGATNFGGELDASASLLVLAVFAVRNPAVKSLVEEAV